MYFTTAVAAASLLATTQAHIALWNRGMYGYNYPYQAADSIQNYNNNEPVTPLKEADALTVEQWFGHGYKDFPPRAGDFMELPSGGIFRGELDCNRAGTTMRDPVRTDPLFQYACSGADGVGALHTMNRYFQPADPKWFGGTSLGIAYTSNIHGLSPNDMTIISVNQNSVWEREISYAIPAGLPPCPPEGCICSWNWIHRANNGEGYPFEIYNLLYRCRITGQTNAANTVQRGAVPRDCTGNSANCVTGPKTGLYLYQRTGNNLPHLDIPPSYTNEWGFSDGAQNDIFVAAAAPAPTTGITNPRATPTNGVPSDNPLPTATALPQNWEAIGCVADDGNPRILSAQLYISKQNTISMCVERANAAGYRYAAVEYGEECWGGNSTVIHTRPESECDVRCAGDEWAFCGGSWKAHLFQKVVPPTQATVSASNLPSASPSPTISPISTSPAASPSSTTTAPATTQPATTLPATTSPATTSPATTSPATTSPATTSPATTSPATTSPATTSPAATSRATTSPATTSPATTSPATTSPGTTSPSPTTTSPAASTETAANVNLLAGWSYLGCHAEPSSFRSINGTFLSSQTMTVETCISHCVRRGYTFAGLQWRTSCYCGNAMYSSPTTGCDTACGGNSGQMCGGVFKNSVFARTAGGRPVAPAPAPTTAAPTTQPNNGGGGQGPVTVTVTQTVYPSTCPTTCPKRRTDW